jgi:SAM-dependent methyltransferase
VRAVAGLDYRHGWDSRDLDAYARVSGLDQRATAVVDALSALGVRSVLEVGSGPGFLTRAARERLGLVGYATDVTAAFDRSLLGRCAVADGRALPFRGGSFEVVLASEVLEHLDLPTLTSTAAEMLRVSSKFVVVTVPHREPLDLELVRCRHCRSQFNSSGHLNSMSETDVCGAFRRAAQRMTPIGTDRDPPRAFVPLLLALRRGLSPSWEPGEFSCPLCGSSTALDTPDGSVRALLYLRARGLLRRLGRTRPGKMLYVFEK